MALPEPAHGVGGVVVDGVVVVGAGVVVVGVGAVVGGGGVGAGGGGGPGVVAAPALSSP